MLFLRDTIFSETVYYASGARLFPYDEDKPGYVAPAKYSAVDSSFRDDEVTLATPQKSLSPTQTVDADAPSSQPNTRDIELGSSSNLNAQHTENRKDPCLVDWDGPNDTDNPLHWSKTKKAFVTGCLCLLTFAIYIGSAIYTPGEIGLAAEFGVSQTASILGLTLFVIGYGVGPLFLSPLSEIPSIGRNKPYIGTLFIFVWLVLGCALVKNFAGFLVLRFLSGFFGSPPLATVGASIADMYEAKTRAYAMGVWGMAAVLGPVMGPLIGGFASENLGWRWTMWPLLMLSGGSLIFLFFFLPETSGNNILYRRAARLRRVTGNNQLYTAGETLQANMTTREIAMMCLVRPFELMFREPIVLAMNTYIAFVYALLYMWFEAFPLVFVKVHGFTPGLLGLAFFGILFGVVLTYAGFCLYCHFIVEPMFERQNGVIDPEDRLPPAMIGSLFIPFCLFFFGWTSTKSIHWIVPIIASSFFGSGAFLMFNSVLNYLSDAYPLYAASVLAGNDFFRSMVGGALPLFANALFVNLQKKNGPAAFPVAWGCTLLGCIGLVMVPIPYVLYYHGRTIRTYSKYADHDGNNADSNKEK